MKKYMSRKVCDGLSLMTVGLSLPLVFDILIKKYGDENDKICNL